MVRKTRQKRKTKMKITSSNKKRDKSKTIVQLIDDSIESDKNKSAIKCEENVTEPAEELVAETENFSCNVSIQSEQNAFHSNNKIP